MYWPLPARPHLRRIPVRSNQCPPESVVLRVQGSDKVAFAFSILIWRRADRQSTRRGSFRDQKGGSYHDTTDCSSLWVYDLHRDWIALVPGTGDHGQEAGEEESASAAGAAGYTRHERLILETGTG